MSTHLMKGPLIDFAEKTPLVNYEQVYKNNRIISFQVRMKK